jgi:hypothetical protein
LITGREDYPAGLRAIAAIAKTRASGQVIVP